MDREQLDAVAVAVIEDHPVAVDGVRVWLEADPQRRVQIVATGSAVDEVLAGPGRRADVLLLDLDLHGRVVTDRISGLCESGRRVVVFSALTDGGTIQAVHAAGAHGFVGKHEGRDHLVAAVVAAGRDRPYVTPVVGGAIATDTAVSPRLSPRERTALLYWFQCSSKQAVAHRMGISESAVRRYIERARLKYTAQGRTAVTQFALLARAIEDGLIRTEDIQEYRSSSLPPGS
jgi:two-component system, NarL family, nitrate/nitrite response regulator NarL